MVVIGPATNVARVRVVRSVPLGRGDRRRARIRRAFQQRLWRMRNNCLRRGLGGGC